MSHYILGAVIVVLGMIYFSVGFFKIRYWIFGRNERSDAQEGREERIFRIRKIKGIFGIILGVVVILFGNF